MDFLDLPPGWTKGELVPESLRYEDTPASPDPAKTLVQGLREGDDAGHRYYSIPADIPVADLVRFFEVGSHAVLSYGCDKQETIEMVARYATCLSELIPSRVTFADSAGLKLRFLRQITEEDLREIETLFANEQNPMQAGLDAIFCDWDGEGSVYKGVMRSNEFHFWWD